MGQQLRTCCGADPDCAIKVTVRRQFPTAVAGCMAAAWLLHLSKIKASPMRPLAYLSARKRRMLGVLATFTAAVVWIMPAQAANYGHLRSPFNAESQERERANFIAEGRDGDFCQAHGRRSNF
jgi:hypothetical protein